MSRKSKLYLIQVLSAIFGVALSLYLLVQHTRLKSGIQGSQSFCSINSYLDCDVVNASPFSELAGIPVATFGAIFYFVALLLILLSRQKWLKWLSIAGLVVDVALLIVQFAQLRTF